MRKITDWFKALINKSKTLNVIAVMAVAEILLQNFDLLRPFFNDYYNVIHVLFLMIMVYMRTVTKGPIR